MTSHPHDPDAALERELAGLRAFERKAQMRFILPADLDRQQRLAVKTEPVVEQLESIGDQLARDLDDVFLLDRGGLVGQFARHAVVLGEHRQAARMRLQRQVLRQAKKMLLEQPDAGMVICCTRVGAD